MVSLVRPQRKLGYRPIQEIFLENLTFEVAQQARDRLVAAIGSRDGQDGPLLSELFSDDNCVHPFPFCRRGKKNSTEHRKKISQALKGKKYPESRNKKISETMKGRPQPHKKGNLNRAKSYILISPAGERQMVHNLKGACASLDLNLNPSNLIQVSRGVRRHHLGWYCLPADFFDWK